MPLPKADIDRVTPGRRRFLGFAAAAAVAGMTFPAAAARRLLRPRAVSLHNLHTGEALNTVYWADGRYLPDAVQRIQWLLRDHRTDEVHTVDPQLLDLLLDLQSRLHTHAPFEILSGYRSPQTNALLAATTDGVAQNSLHIEGMAVDIRVPGRGLHYVRAAAMSLRAGGVGYYPHSDFVHVDTGRIRYW
jgi:uncharacterized protein YcbK (DUF882 family)